MHSEEKWILVVEDNPDDVALMMRALRQSDIGSRVRIVHDGHEAVEVLLNDHTPFSPKLVLLDLKLPILDGVEVLRRLRDDDRTRGLPVVVFTSSDEEVDITNCYKAGANSFIRKPLDFDAFLDAMKQLGSYWLGLNMATFF